MRWWIVLGCVLALGPMVSAQAESDHFGLAATFPGEGDGDTPPQAVFAPDVPKITLGVKLHDVKPGDTIKATWIAVSAEGAPANYEIDASTVTVVSDNQVVAFRLSKPNAGWPTGAYRVDLSFNGDKEASQAFTVE